MKRDRTQQLLNVLAAMVVQNHNGNLLVNSIILDSEYKMEVEDNDFGIRIRASRVTLESKLELYEETLQRYLRGEATEEEVREADPLDDALRRMAERAYNRRNK